jgi:hypothetical protein
VVFHNNCNIVENGIKHHNPLSITEKKISSRLPAASKNDMCAISDDANNRSLQVSEYYIIIFLNKLKIVENTKKKKN